MRVIALVFAFCAVYGCHRGSALAQPADFQLPERFHSGHSHNDYNQQQPLWLALENGFASFEADVYLRRDSQLMVAHLPWQTKPGRSLRKLYLEPLDSLRKVLAQRPIDGRGLPELQLLVDMKSNGGRTLPVLNAILAEYPQLVARWDSTGQRSGGALRVVLSGNVPPGVYRSTTARYWQVDGRQPQLVHCKPPHLVPLVSMNWRDVFRWDGQGTPPEETVARLLELHQQAQDCGCKLRFWNAPDTPAVWVLLQELGGTYVHTDRPVACGRVLLAE